MDYIVEEHLQITVYYYCQYIFSPIFRPYPSEKRNDADELSTFCFSNPFTSITMNVPPSPSWSYGIHHYSKDRDWFEWPRPATFLVRAHLTTTQLTDLLISLPNGDSFINVRSILLLQRVCRHHTPRAKQQGQLPFSPQTYNKSTGISLNPNYTGIRRLTYFTRESALHHVYSSSCCYYSFPTPLSTNTTAQTPGFNQETFRISFIGAAATRKHGRFTAHNSHINAQFPLMNQ